MRSNKVPTSLFSERDFDSISPEEVQDPNILSKRLSDFFSFMNFFNKNLSISKNFPAGIVQAVVPSSSDVAIQHFLGVKPQYRILLGQEGNGYITDVPSLWTDKVIVVRNPTASQVTVTLLVLKD